MAEDQDIPPPNGSAGKRRGEHRNKTHKTKSNLEKEEMIARITELDRKGYSQTEIGKIVGLSQPMVSKYRKWAMARYIKHAVHDKKSLVERQIHQLNDVIRLAYQAFEKSMQDSVEIVETRDLQQALDNLAGDGEEEPRVRSRKRKKGRPKSSEQKVREAIQVLTKIVTTRKGRLPANEYLTQIRQCIHQIAELKGLYPTPDEMAGKGTEPLADVWGVWSLPSDKTEVDSVERRLEDMSPKGVKPTSGKPVEDAEFTIVQLDKGDAGDVSDSMENDDRDGKAVEEDEE